MLDMRQIPTEYTDAAKILIEDSEPLGLEIHIRTDYGDERGGLTPWDLFDKSDAKEALDVADKVVQSAKGLVSGLNEEE